MRRRTPIRPAKRSEDITILDRVTNAVFVAVLMFSVAEFISYGPRDACRHIADVIASCASDFGTSGAPDWQGAMAD